MAFILKIFSVFAIIFVSIMIQRMTTKNDDLSHLKELPHRLEGNKESNNLLVFLHGWPNKMSMFNSIIKRLESDFYCLSITYPNFSEDLKVKVGTDFNTIIDLIALTIKNVQNSSGKKFKVTVIGHDYGAFFTYLLDSRHQDLIDSMVTLDVAHIFSKSISSALFNTSYQSWLAVSNGIGGPVGDAMCKIMGKVYGLLDKTTMLEKIEFDFDSNLTYLYVEIFKSIFDLFKFGDEYIPNKPLTFIYGKDKPTTFHEQKALDIYNSKPGNTILALETGHWITITHEDVVIEEIKKRALGN